jgi:hypothetical protein
MQVLRGGKLLWLVLISCGWCAAQDTNFAAGPQYLINYGSPLFLHSIETPSLSLSTPPATNPGAPAEEGTGEPSSPAVGGLKSQSTVDRIYWGVNTISANVGEMPGVESSASPSNTSSSSASSAGASSSSSSSSTSAEAATAGKSSEIELSSAEPSRPLPSSIVDVGVAAVMDAQSRYGTPLGEVAAYWKANKPQVSRVLTNADIARLHNN